MMRSSLRNQVPALGALFCLLAVPYGFAQSGHPAQPGQPTPPLNDPANLAGERVGAPALADDLPIDHGAPALEQLLRKLRTRASMMLIVAHPDDEDSGLLTLESRGAGARVAMLTLNRGEGGQNLMSADFDEALGLIRTQELLAEDRFTGVDQMFGTEVDFGFSKTKEEAFSKWTHDRVLYDAVRAVRMYRPLVLASVFVGGPTDGHGHHQVAGEITQEVFKAAADPNVFPEMLKDGLLPWAPLKVYARVPFSRVTSDGMFDYATGKIVPTRFTNYVTGAVSDRAPVATVLIHEGDKPDIPAFHGLSYVQWARQGLALQKSQIGAGFRVPPAGVVDVGYTLMGSRLDCTHRTGSAPCPMHVASGVSGPSATITPPAELPQHEDSLFEGIDTSLPGVADLAPGAPASLRADLAAIDSNIAQAQKLYSPNDIERTAPPLRQALSTLNTLLASIESSSLPGDQKRNLLHELRIKRVQLNDALVLAHGLTLKAMFDPESNPYDVLTGQTEIKAHVVLTSQSRDPFALRSTEFGLEPEGKHSQTAGQALGSVAPHASRELPATLSAVTGLVPTQPYFSRPDIEQPFYNIADAALRNAPATPPPLLYVARLDDAGATLELAASVASPPDREAPHPAVPRAANIIPDVQIALRPATGIFTPAETSQRLTVTSTSDSRTKSLAGLDLSVQAGAEHLGGPMILPSSLHTKDFLGVDLMSDFTFSLDSGKPLPTLVEASLASPSHTYTESFRPVGYEGLTPTNLYTSATFHGVPVDVVTAPHLRVAYLAGTGDSVPQYLKNLGVEAMQIFPSDLTPARLAQYDEVILGVRAYAAHPELAGAGSQPLLDFARGGGVVVVQYNSGGFNPASAPYPYTLPGDSAHNVVEETQPVRILAPDAPLLTWPNHITAADFNNWVEERGHGFAATWAPEYEALLETHDAGQDPQKGGLLVAPVGKGAYIYCALALYRQLPEAVPGAYRLFANLLSYPKNPGRSH